jgi:phospholipid/cholesterol/gamma-HCH transport system permease protein
MKELGKYLLLMGKLLVNREKFSTYARLIIDEAIVIGTDSLLIVAIVSSFIGAVTAVQTAHNLYSPIIPLETIGSIVRDMTLLELAPTFTGVVLAGKIGSNIAGHLGSMRITEQIDALEVMGINSASYLILPKIVASLIVFPMLVTLSAFLGIFGGFVAGVLTNSLSAEQYIAGIRDNFHGFDIFFALIKAFVFAFLISSISAFRGYYTRGGALEIGKASTMAVTHSCIAILIADYLLAQLILAN